MKPVSKDQTYVRVNFILPRNVYRALKALIPQRKRSQLITRLIKIELGKREKALYKAAKAAEGDPALRQEMQAWDETLVDGLEDIEWK